MKRIVALGLIATAALAGTAPASAKHKKPLTKTYTATAPAPDPTNFNPAARYSVCEQTVPNSFHVERLKVTEAGKLVVDMRSFQGDWDLLIMDSKGNEMGFAGATNPVDGDSEKATVKVKRPGEVQIVACNWAGGPSAQVKYTFTFDR